MYCRVGDTMTKASLNDSESLWIYSFFFLMFLFYFWLCWVFVAACWLSLAVASRGFSSLQYVGLLQWLLLLRITDSNRKGFSSCVT